MASMVIGNCLHGRPWVTSFWQRTEDRVCVRLSVLGRRQEVDWHKFATSRRPCLYLQNLGPNEFLSQNRIPLPKSNSSPKMLIVKLYIQILTFTTQYTFENLRLWPRMHANIEIQYTWPPGIGKLDITMAWVENRLVDA